MENTVTVRSNLATLITLKGERDGEKITISQLARDTGLAMNTVKKWLRGNHDYFEGHAVAILCKYLECEIGDLLKIVEPTDTQD